MSHSRALQAHWGDNPAESLIVRRTDTGRIAATHLTHELPAAWLGINTTANSQERLQVASRGVLFTHDSTTPTTPDVRIKVNKGASTGSAAIDFQTSWSGRVELGLAQDDVLRCKASPDGTSWKVAWSVDPATGWLGIGTDAPRAQVPILRGLSHPIIKRIDNEFGGPGFEAYRARGAVGALQPPITDDVVNALPSGGHDGASYVAAGNIRWRVESLSGPGELRTWMEVMTANGSPGTVEPMRVTSAGHVGIGTPTPTTRLDVNGPVRVGTATVASLPPAAATGAGAIIYVSNAAGGPELAFSDGTDWRRVSDRSNLAI